MEFTIKAKSHENEYERKYGHKQPKYSVHLSVLEQSPNLYRRAVSIVKEDRILQPTNPVDYPARFQTVIHHLYHHEWNTSALNDRDGLGLAKNLASLYILAIRYGSPEMPNSVLLAMKLNKYQEKPEEFLDIAYIIYKASLKDEKKIADFREWFKDSLTEIRKNGDSCVRNELKTREGWNRRMEADYMEALEKRVENLEDPIAKGVVKG